MKKGKQTFASPFYKAIHCHMPAPSIKNLKYFY